MPGPIKPGNINFNLSFKKAAESAPIGEDAPLRMAILGDFSGRPGDGANACHALRVDCDNFDAICGRFGAALQVPASAPGALEIVLRFTKLDDFHPDHLLRTVPALASLVQLRAKLLTPGSADSAAAEVREMFKGGATVPAAESITSPHSESTDDTFARLLGKPATEVAKASRPKSIAEQLIQQAVASSIIPAPGADHSELLSMLETDITARLRGILHHPGFQALEAAWRGLDFLVREAGDNVKLHAIDIARDELDRQLASLENPAATVIGRALEPLAPHAIIGAFSFGAKDADALRRIACLAGVCGTAFLGSACPDLIGCASFATQPNSLDWAKTTELESQAFAELRRAPESAHVGLALPRFLLRQPYGRESDPIQAFPFEELPAGDAHECYLWGNPAFLCGRLLLDSFASDGWEMDLSGVGGEIGGLPVHAFNASDEKQNKPCAEAWLSDRAADAILGYGLMPVLSVRGRDSVLLGRLHSLSDPASQLAFGRS